MLRILRPKKSSLVSGNQPGENFYHLPAHIVECESEYIFSVSKIKHMGRRWGTP